MQCHVRYRNSARALPDLYQFRSRGTHDICLIKQHEEEELNSDEHRKQPTVKTPGGEIWLQVSFLKVWGAVQPVNPEFQVWKAGKVTSAPWNVMGSRNVSLGELEIYVCSWNDACYTPL